MIVNLFMGLILMASVFLTGGLGLGIIYIMEYCRKETKENTGKENEMLFLTLGLIIYMIYQFWFYMMLESEGIISFYWSTLGSWIYFEFSKIGMSENMKKTGGDTRFFDKNKYLLYLILVIFCIINVIVYKCIK
ncbi:hypothetical protein [Leptotrichia sp. oral taxon 879]|uniref:hypothetical protein n=1 Tax=Leptotrichia sp. oral taxon 879 TaxID=1227267 RepID=UPI0003AD8FF4|nr:hypothetical protein [Leptotrichia sp. oral taxon 879]ERK55391.1 hypothetical protein HMPREF1552_00196 [Leptotrichia sp. oral taxon 879 str. F0557]